MASDPVSRPRDALDHPLYRIAHLHDAEWVTLRPEEQHDARHDGMEPPWPGATTYVCDRCGDRVVAAPVVGGAPSV